MVQLLCVHFLRTGDIRTFTGSENRPNLQGLVLDGQAQIKD